MRKYVIKSDTFVAPLVLIIGTNQECANFLNREQINLKPEDKYYVDDPNVLGQYSQFINELKCGYRRVIWLKQFRKNNIHDLGVLVHEIQHYVLRTLRDKGMKIDSTYHAEEAYTYLLESIFVACLNKLKNA